MCESGCGVLYPILVSRTAAGASCVACGARANQLSRDEALDRVRGTMRAIFGDDDLNNVNARLAAVREVGDMLRYIDAHDAPKMLR